MEAHEDEYDRLISYEKANRTLIELVKKRLELLEKQQELQSKANDPKRYNNRGGALLKEEKERKRIDKVKN